MADALSPLPIQHFVDSNGIALVGGKVFTYQAGSTTKIATFTDSTGGTPNTNPVILNARGEANIWIVPGTLYKFVLAPANDTDPPTNAIWTEDNISTPAVGTLGAQNANAVAITGGTIAGVAITGGTIAGAAITGGTIIGLATPLAPADGGAGGALRGNAIGKGANYTVSNATDKGATFVKNANGQFTLTYTAPAGYDNNFQNYLYNPPGNTNGWLMNISGLTSGIYLYPGQELHVFKDDANNWQTYPALSKMPKIKIPGGIFADASKSNSNDGITAATAFADVNTAYLFVKNSVEVGNGGYSINVADGTYNIGAGLGFFYPIGPGPLGITGNNTTPGNCIFQCSAGGTAITGRDQPTVIITGVKYVTLGNGSVVSSLSQGAVVDFEFSEFTAFPLGGLITTSGAGASTNVISNNTVSGSFVSGFTASEGSHMQVGDAGATMSLPNALTFTFFFVVTTNAVFTVGPPGYTYSGAGAGAGSTGTKFINQVGGYLSLGGNSPPGATAGTTDAATFAITQ